MCGLEHFPKTERIVRELGQEIAEGRHGRVSQPFMTTRYLMTYKGVSLKTAHRVLGRLCSDGLLEVRGKRYYLKGAEKPESRHAPRIGLLLTRLDTPYFSNLASCLEETVRKRGASVEIAVSAYDGELERKRLEMFVGSGIDGIIACPWAVEQNEALYASLPVPLVLIGRTLPHAASDAVLVDNLKAAKQTAGHLIAAGCTDFFYAGPANLPDDQRLAGFREGLSAQGRTLPGSHVFALKDENAPLDALRRHLVKNPARNRRAGVFCYHDLFAARVIRLCHEERIPVPARVAVAGFDNLPVASAVWPPLTSVAYPVREIAETAVKLLFARLKGDREGAPETCYLEPELVVRKSTKTDTE